MIQVCWFSRHFLLTSSFSDSLHSQVLSMFDKAEKEYKDLLQKKKIVEEDKSKVG